jgi:hypothetical protein
LGEEAEDTRQPRFSLRIEGREEIKWEIRSREDQNSTSNDGRALEDIEEDLLRALNELFEKAEDAEFPHSHVNVARELEQRYEGEEIAEKCVMNKYNVN